MSTSVPIRPPPIHARRPRTSRVALIAAAALLLVLVAAIWILPSMLDWNRYRSSIASLVAAGIGRPVQIDGNITLTLLPQPVLTATDLDVDDDGDGVAMRIHAVRLRVALGPLIAGRVDARELTLQGADIRLPWPPPTGALSQRPPAWITGLQARAEDTRLQIGDLVLTGVDAALAADPDTGTLSAAGTATLFDRPTRVTIRLGRPGRDGAAPVDISLDGQDSPGSKLHDTGGTVSGTIEADGSLSGRLTARGPDLSQLLPAPAAAFRADGRISAAGGVLVADELAIEIGGAPARGAISLRVQPDLRLDLALTASRLDLDAWTPVMIRATQPGHPIAIPTGIDLSADTATLSGGVLRQVRTAVDIDADAVSIREANGILPGDATLALHGSFPQRGKTIAFDGTGTLVAPDLRTTLHWLEPVAPDIVRAVPAGAFRTANLAAHLAADPAQLSLTDLKGTLDTGAIQGGLALRFGTRPAISFGLTMDRLLLDPFLPSRDILADPAAAYTALIKSLATTTFDSDLKLQIRQADWRGARFGPLAIDAQNDSGHLTIRRLEATLAGLHTALSGTIGEAGRVSEGRVELTAQDVGPLRPFLPSDAWATELAPLVQGPINLLATAAGSPEALAIRATLELSDLHAEAQPVLNVTAHRWTSSLTLQHPSAARLLRQLGVADTEPWLGAGSMSLIAQLAKVPGRLDLATVDLVAGELRAGGQLVVSGRSISGRVRAETLTLPMVDPRSAEPLPLAALSTADGALHVQADRVLVGLAPILTDLVADIAVRDGALAIDDLSARRDGATLTGTARLQPAATPAQQPKLSLRGQLDGLVVSAPLLGSPLDLVSGTLAASLDIGGDGFSPSALAATLAGSGSVSVRDGELVGFDLIAASDVLGQAAAATVLPTLRSTMLKGSTTVSTVDIPFDVHGGLVTLHATATTNPGPGFAPAPGATLNGTIDLSGATIDGRLTLLPGPDLPKLPVRLGGPLVNPVRTPELAGAALWLAERP